MIFARLPNGKLMLCGQLSKTDRTGLPTPKSVSKPRSAVAQPKPAPALTEDHPRGQKRMRSMTSTLNGPAHALKPPRVSCLEIAAGFSAAGFSSDPVRFISAISCSYTFWSLLHLHCSCL